LGAKIRSDGREYAVSVNTVSAEKKKRKKMEEFNLPPLHRPECSQHSRFRKSIYESMSCDCGHAGAPNLVEQMDPRTYSL
ncbi:Hypothetical predicted protein, partial [Octopus vulgaris]